MISVEEAHRLLSQQLNIEPGKFYGNANHLSLGAGKLYSGIRFPVYDEGEALFSTAEGTIYILSHECDIAQENARAFNSHILICPVIDFRNFVQEYQQTASPTELQQFIASLAIRQISRV